MKKSLFYRCASGALALGALWLPVRAAQPTTAAPTSSFELPRITSHRKAGDPAPVAKTKVTIDDLSSQGSAGAKPAAKHNVSYLVVEAGADLSRTLRGAAKDLAFVSVLVYGSEGTTIDIAGAKIGIVKSDTAGFARVVLGGNTDGHDLGQLVRIESHDGVQLAALPPLTVRLDPAAQVWDAYVFGRLVASDLPLPVQQGAAGKKITLHAGATGAWLCGLITSDENPLYEDANGNGIDDKFEQQQLGKTLAADATAGDRAKLAQAWQANQQTGGSKPWNVRRPMPDGK